MNYQPKNIRTFIGAKNYDESREFYRALGFEEVIVMRALFWTPKSV